MNLSIKIPAGHVKSIAHDEFGGYTIELTESHYSNGKCLQAIFQYVIDSITKLQHADEATT